MTSPPSQAAAARGHRIVQLGCCAAAVPDCCEQKAKFCPFACPPPHPHPLLPLSNPPPQDLALALQLLEEAAQRLQDAIEFLRGSDEPFVALGDVLLERGEKLSGGGDVAGAAAALRRALSEGYQVLVACCLGDCCGELLVSSGQ